MNNTKPLVSVVIPVYNAGEFLAASIESILNQTYQNFEFIIINDASTDNSLKIINKYKKHHQKIKVISLKKNLNCGGDLCANKGLKKAKGKYVARMDADDVAHPKRLETQIEFLEKNPGVFLVGSNAYVIDKKGNLIGNKLEPQTHESIYKSYFVIHPIIHPSCMYRRLLPPIRHCERMRSNHIKRTRLPQPFHGFAMTRKTKFRYEISYSANNDYYIFFKLICQGYKFANLKEKLLYYRIHGNNDTFMHVKEKFLNTLKIRFNMVLHYGYKPTIKDIFTNIIQTIILLTLPERLTTKLYLVSKGIIKPKDLIKQTFYFVKRFSFGAFTLR